MPLYPPSTQLTLSPFALLRFPAARLLWTVLNGASFVLAAAVVISACPELYGWLTCALVSLFLITARTPLRLGQPGILSISFLIVGTILFLRGRYLRLATVLLMLSLAVKPQIGGLVVLYFLIRKIHWRYAVAACAGATALLAIGVLMLQAHPASANWLADLPANTTASLSPGAINDPRPTSPESIAEVNLQALTSVFFEDSTAFNVAAWGIFLGLLTAWAVTVLQEAHSSPGTHYAELAAIAILSLVPVYHRSYDTRLLLLTIPAIPVVLERKRSLGLLVSMVTPLATLPFVQYRIQEYLHSHGKWPTVFRHKLLFAVLLRNQILALVLLFFLYLAAIVVLRGPADEGTGKRESEPV